MSNIVPRNTHENAALEFSPAEMKRRNPSGKKVYKPQMATKVKWALVDSKKMMGDAKVKMRGILDWVHELRQLNSLDMRVLAHLGKLDHQIAYLALDIADVDELLGCALAESRAQDSRQ
jgi:hypothetical protein